MSTYQELLAQKAAIEQQAALLNRQLEDARRAERQEVIAKVKALLAENGLTVADLGGAGAAAGSRKTGALAGQKVAAKYRNEATGETWTGRGLKPKWLAAAIASGKALEDFAI